MTELTLIDKNDLNRIELMLDLCKEANERPEDKEDAISFIGITYDLENMMLDLYQKIGLRIVDEYKKERAKRDEILTQMTQESQQRGEYDPGHILDNGGFRPIT